MKICGKRVLYQYKMFISVVKHFLLYKIPNLILLYVFGDRNGVYAMYESMKYRNGTLGIKYYISMLKLMVSLLCAVVLLPFIVVVFAVNVLLLGKVYIPRIEIVLTTFCSLRCKDCSNLMQYYDKPYHINTDSIIQVLQNLTASIAVSYTHLTLPTTSRV